MDVNIKRETMDFKIGQRSKASTLQYFKANYAGFPKIINRFGITKHGFTGLDDLIETLYPIYRIDSLKSRKYTNSKIGAAFYHRNVKKHLEEERNKAIQRIEKREEKYDQKSIRYNKKGKSSIQGAAYYVTYAFDKIQTLGMLDAKYMSMNTLSEEELQKLEKKYPKEMSEILMTNFKRYKKIKSDALKELSDRVPYKISIACTALYKQFIKLNDDDDKKEHWRPIVNYVNSTFSVVTHIDQVQEVLETLCEEIDKKIDTRPSTPLVGILGFALKFARYKPIRGKSYIELPKVLADKKAIINIKNKDNKCFLYSLLCGLHFNDPSIKNKERVSTYEKYLHKINIPKNTSVPPEFSDYAKFEKANSMSLNVLTCNSKKPEDIKPLYSTKNEIPARHVNLLLYERGEDRHYMCISNMSRLLRSSKTNHKTKVLFCNHCLMHFTNENALNKHKQLGCYEVDPCKISMPKDKEI